MGSTDWRGGATRLRRLLGRGLGAALVTIVLLELGARVAFPLPEIANFDRLWYAGQPEVGVPSLAHASVWWWSQADGAASVRRLNLYGFRGPTWDLRSRPGVRRIGFFGDSFVEGLGAGDDETIPGVFARGARAAGRRWEVLNFGAGGFDLEENLPLIRDATEFFGLDEVALFVYANDLYTLPEPGPLLDTPRTPLRRGPAQMRLSWVWKRLRSGERLPRRWHDRAGVTPRPLAVGPRFERDPGLMRTMEQWVEPELAEMMRGGTLNPAVSNLLNRSFRVLERPVAAEPVVAALAEHLAFRQVDLAVVYLPSLNQASDAYLPAQRRLSAPIGEPTLTGERFQRQARDLARACATGGVAFFDTTPGLARRERNGERLYWPYDSHMRAAGYRAVAEDVLAWRLDRAP